MTVMVKFPHIEQFRNVVRHVANTVRYNGRDENGEPIYHNIPLPVLKFRGTVKLHGTNAAVGVLNDGQTYWAQSRENIITPEQDNAGFATFVYSKRNVFIEIANQIHYDKSKYKGLVIYGEWCGGNIQKGVAISNLPKMFVVFGIKLLANNNEEEANAWLKSEEWSPVIGHREDDRIFNIYTFGHWEVDIDFNRPETITNHLCELTEKVEECCPVGKFFGFEGIGEGIVWNSVTEPYIGGNFMFKVKGEKHSASKIKKLATVDIEKVNSIKECVDKILTENRLNQGIEHLRMNGLEPIDKNTGEFIKWVTTDAIREELDTIVGSGLEPKDIGKEASKVAREWYFKNFVTV